MQDRRGKFNFHHLVDGLTSVTLEPADENALDVVSLAPTQIDTFRTMIRLRLEFFQSSQTFGMRFLTAASIPGLVVGGPGWGIFLLGGVIAEAGLSFANNTMAPLQTIADQMLTDVQVYRLVLPVKSAEGLDYVRYVFAVKPASQKLLVLRNCVYARH